MQELMLPFLFFFFNDTATTEIYTLSLHDALPISVRVTSPAPPAEESPPTPSDIRRSEEHTSELQSRFDLVCRLLLETKKQNSLCSCIDRNRRLKTSSNRRITYA